MLNLLARLQGDLGISIVVITHNLNVVRHITDRMGIMYLGRLVEQGPTDILFEDPRHPYTLALLSANPEPDPDAVSTRLELQGEVPSLINRPSGCEFHPALSVCRDALFAGIPGERVGWRFAPVSLSPPVTTGGQTTAAVSIMSFRSSLTRNANAAT